VTCDRCRDGVLDLAGAAEVLGIQPGSVARARYRQSPAVPPEDGTVSGMPFWWPSTVRAWTKRKAQG